MLIRICLGFLLPVPLFALGCPEQHVDPFTQVMPAQKAAAGVITSPIDPSLIAFTDGLEASSDGAGVGVDVVVAQRGAELLRSPADVAVRGLALGSRSVASIELKVSVADQRVRVRQIEGGDPVDAEKVDTPLAIAAVQEGYVWVEARVDSVDGNDGIFALTLVEGDQDGDVNKRTAFDAGELRMPVAGVAPLPTPFGLAVAGDDVWFGWRSDLCNGGSQLIHINRNDGSGLVEWLGRVAAVSGAADPATGACSCDNSQPDNVTDRARSVAAIGGVAIVVGGVADCAAVVDKSGFVRSDADEADATDPILFVATSPGGTFAATADALVLLDGTKVTAPVKAPAKITGLAIDAVGPLIATEKAIFHRTPGDEGVDH